MNNEHILIPLYEKLSKLTREKKCAWEMSSEVNTYYLQLQSSMIRVGEDNRCKNEPPVYVFQYIKENKQILDKRAKSSDSNEYGILNALYHNIEYYYDEMVRNAVKEVSSELDKL